ncbi:hypothetical protein ACK8OR_06440 [Jannaschia sp. KMU-145]|uniref:hypothetical protein n=1 Tax=Jannaschia halovivens TaxID=3388667 RepID=UPI00396B25DB
MNGLRDAMRPTPDGMTPAASAAQRRARRRARTADAARLLPFLGIVLFFAPDLVLSGRVAADGASAGWLGYLFAAWLLLIGLGVWIGRRHVADGADTEAGG